MSRKILALCVVLLAWSGIKAQDVGVHGNGAAADTAVVSDSMRIAMLEQQLEAARLSEANMALEMAFMREASSSDSARRAQRRHRFDSLRANTSGAPVVVDGDTLFCLYAKNGGVPPERRAAMAIEAIEKIGETLLLHPDSVYIDSTDIVTDIMYGHELIVSFSDHDALWAGCTRDTLAMNVRAVVVEKLHDLKSQHGIWQWIKRIALVLLTFVAFYFVFRLTNRLIAWMDRRVNQIKDTHFKPIFIQNVELLSTDKQVGLLLVMHRLLRYVILLVALAFMVPVLFSFFPQTKELAYTLLSYILNPAYNICVNVVAYIPNLFTIFVIYISIKYLVRLIEYLAHEVEHERLKINGFFPDWAMPTFYIIRFLLYAFMIAMVYPYLPGADSGIFQGISVFLGLIVSLGSSTVIGNIIAGFVITYMRPFKIGDRISLGDTTGNVIEKTPLVTRIRTPKNEVVTMPNSFLMSSQTVNYSQSARQYGLIIHTEVTIGYDVPWRQVHELLINAALCTPGVQEDPRPFVLETGLNDWYPVYQLNAYITDADQLGQIYSDLHANIQDRFHEAGVEIMSPHYMAMRDGNASTIPNS